MAAKQQSIMQPWDDLPFEEQEARTWYAEYILKRQHPELFA